MQLQSILFMSCLLAGIVGCSSQQPSAEIAESEGTFDAAMIAFESSDFQLAEEQLTAAIEAGGLNPDLVAEAYLLRAESRAKLGKFSEAMTDLNGMDQRAPDKARYYQIRGDVLLGQGDNDAAKAAYAAARKIDRTIELPDSLR